MNAIVTGAASGIGRALVAGLARQGHRVVACDINEAGLASARADDHWPERVRVCTLDVRSAADWDAAVALADGSALDLLCNVAGVIRPGYIHDATPADIDFHVDINIKGVMLGTRAGSARMVAQGYGHIVNIASMAALAPVPGLDLYSASKFAVRGFSLAIAPQLARRGVAVSCVCPDAVDTPMLDAQIGYDEASWTFAAKPIGPDDVVDAIIGEVLVRKPVEIVVADRSRKWLAKLGNLVPTLTHGSLAGRITKAGRARQDRVRAKRAY